MSRLPGDEEFNLTLLVSLINCECNFKWYISIIVRMRAGGCMNSIWPLSANLVIDLQNRQICVSTCDEEAEGDVAMIGKWDRIDFGSMR